MHAVSRSVSQSVTVSQSVSQSVTVSQSVSQSVTDSESVSQSVTAGLSVSQSQLEVEESVKCWRIKKNQSKLKYSKLKCTNNKSHFIQIECSSHISEKSL